VIFGLEVLAGFAALALDAGSTVSVASEGCTGGGGGGGDDDCCGGDWGGGDGRGGGGGGGAVCFLTVLLGLILFFNGFCKSFREDPAPLADGFLQALENFDLFSFVSTVLLLLLLLSRDFFLVVVVVGASFSTLGTVFV
jgi:hypothetical protein